MFVGDIIFYALKQALGIKNDECEWTNSPFMLHAMITKERSNVKEISIYHDYQEIEIFCDKLHSSTVNSLKPFGSFVMYPIEIKEDDEILKRMPSIEHGILIRITW